MQTAMDIMNFRDIMKVIAEQILLIALIPSMAVKMARIPA
jgi:hypothetical protein